MWLFFPKRSSSQRSGRLDGSHSLKSLKRITILVRSTESAVNKRVT
jgi:hypothetical protein